MEAKDPLWEQLDEAWNNMEDVWITLNDPDKPYALQEMVNQFKDVVDRLVQRDKRRQADELHSEVAGKGGSATWAV